MANNNNSKSIKKKNFKNKPYPNKGIIYLVLLIAVILGTLFFTSIINTQKPSTNPEAKNKNTCHDNTGKSGFIVLATKSCQSHYTAQPSADIENINDHGSTQYQCCVADVLPALVGADKPNCTDNKGADWYSMDVSTFQTKYSVKYLFDVKDITSEVNPNQKHNASATHCLQVGKMIPRQKCEGAWLSRSGGACANSQNGDIYKYRDGKLDSKQYADYSSHQGQFCCIRGKKLDN